MSSGSSAACQLASAPRAFSSAAGLGVVGPLAGGVGRLGEALAHGADLLVELHRFRQLGAQLVGEGELRLQAPPLDATTVSGWVVLWPFDRQAHRVRSRRGEQALRHVGVSTPGTAAMEKS